MAVRPAEGVEPITGYRLINRLGTGGYGEVWKATAPGGLTKAVKIIYGHLRDARAEQELRAMNRMKEVRHPFLLSLERVEISDDQLFIVTELADSSLMDRFQACRKAGSAGVPRDELIAYVRDAADALDYMNDHYSLQHLDIKPQNLLLVGGRIKIADFGLVKDLHGTSTTATGGVTPIYASPEAFDGKVSRFSDQYSLGVVYQEMLTGIRPFPGKSALQLAAQHMNSPPLLDPLPPNDRAVIGRALAKVAEQRFPSCREMVEALQRPASSPSTLALWQTPPAPAPVERPRNNQTTPISGHTADEAEEDLLSLETIVGFQAPRTGARTPSRESATQGPTSTVRPRRASNVRLRPTLFLALGGLAGMMLYRLRQRLREHFGALNDVPIFRFVHVDTDRSGLRHAQQRLPDTELEPAETLLVPLRKAEHYRGESKDLLRWLDRRWLYGIPRSLATEGIRPLGRLALIDNAPDLFGKLHEALLGITSAEAKAKTSEATGLNLREATPRIFIIAGIAGGTGSGMALDTGYLVRQVLHELHLSSDGVCAVLLHASGDKPGEHELARVNSYAALTELNHFYTCDRSYPGDPRRGLRSFEPGETPFQDCYVVRLGEQLSQNDIESATDALAAYLYLDAATPAGAFLDQYRQSTADAGSSPGDGAMLRTLGVHQLAFPRHAIAGLLAPVLCRQVIERWLEGPGDDIQQIQSETSARTSEIGLEAETMMDRLDAAVRSHWDEDADKFLQRNLTDWLHDAAQGGQEKPIAELANNVLPKIDKLLGNGLPVGPQPDSGTPLQMRVRDEAQQLGARIGRAAVEWLTSRVNDSRGGVGATAEAIRYLQRQLTSLIESGRYLLDDGCRNRMSLWRQAKAGEVSGQAGNRWLAGRARRPDLEAQLQAHLLTICRLRLKEILLENALDVFRHVSDQLSKFAQQMAVVRDRLQHLADRFAALALSRRASVEAGLFPASVSILLPQETDTLISAAESIYKTHESHLLSSFEDCLRQQLLKAEGGLCSILSRSGDEVAGLYDRLETPARKEVLAAISQINAATLFTERHRETDQAEHALTNHVRSAAPLFAINGSWSHLIVVTPGGVAGSPLGETISKVCAQGPLTVLESDSDVFFCFEATHLSLRAVAADLALEGNQFFDAVARVMTRTDVAWASLRCEDQLAAARSG
jgi:eukaryotic-like serine/threonine-protein kinase